MYKILALDLDGTLLNSRKEVTPRTISAIESVAKAGLYPVICTGRMIQSAKKYWDILELDTPIIGYNGAYVKHPESNREIYHKPIPPSATRLVVNFCRRENLHVQAYMNDIMYVEQDNDYSREYGKTYGVGYNVVESLDILFTTGSTKLLVLTDPERLDITAESLQKACGQDVRVMPSEQTHIEVIYASVSKGIGISIVAGYYGVSLEEVVAIGDGANDVDMLRCAGLSVATENACAEAKAVADRVIPSNNDDGVARFVFDLLLNSRSCKSGKS